MGIISHLLLKYILEDKGGVYAKTLNMSNKIHKNCDFTKEEIDVFLHSRKVPYDVTLEQVIEYWNKKGWMTLKGVKVSSVSSAVNVANSYVIQQKRKNGVIGFDDVLQNKDESKEWKNNKSPYNDQLNTPQWKAFREFIFAVRGRKCESCGKPSSLHVHHREYIKNRFAWEYLPNEVMVLCADCHRYIHKLDK